jgi:hypothetical protein
MNTITSPRCGRRSPGNWMYGSGMFTNGMICGVEGPKISRLTKRKSPAITVFSIEPVGTTKDATASPLMIMTTTRAPKRLRTHEIAASRAFCGLRRRSLRRRFHCR